MGKKPPNLDMSMGDVGSDKWPSKSFLKHLQQGWVLVNRLSAVLFADQHSDSL
jgi:hypothetical protein